LNISLYKRTHITSWRQLTKKKEENERKNEMKKSSHLLGIPKKITLKNTGATPECVKEGSFFHFLKTTFL